jgi:hypothetical protein
MACFTGLAKFLKCQALFENDKKPVSLQLRAFLHFTGK